MAMPHYAHTLIEHGPAKYEAGHVVPDDLPGLDELVAAGSVSTEPFTRQVTVDGQGRVIGEAHVEAFAGDFTTEQIADPGTETPALGRPGDPAQVNHAADSGGTDA